MPKVGDIVGTKPINSVRNGLRITGTVTYIHDPEAVKRALDSWAEGLIDALPGILARKRAELEGALEQEPNSGELTHTAVGRR